MNIKNRDVMVSVIVEREEGKKDVSIFTEYYADSSYYEEEMDDHFSAEESSLIIDRIEQAMIDAMDEIAKQRIEDYRDAMTG